ncbi:MAG: ABC transporter permease, partial [Myxococcota bacterium]|nr:ABC transporter permease [Myxococcota bacterium]
MRLLRLAARNLKQRPLTSVLTTVSIMFGAALVSFLWLVAGQAERRYVTSSRGFNVVIGPKESSTLDLVLST